VNQRRSLLMIASCLAVACGSSSAEHPAIDTFAPAASAVFVGERTKLTAVFSGGDASIDGIGAIQSGVAVDTPVLARATTFVLHVRRGAEQVDASTTIQANYRNRFRALAPSPVARTNHLTAALPDGRAIAMGGNSSEAINVPDIDTTEIFDPVTETFSTGPDLLFSALAGENTALAQLANGGFLLAGGGINSSTTLPEHDGDVATQVFDGTGFVRVGNAVTRFRADARATALADGGVLLSGGSTPLAIPPVDRYDAATRKWRLVGNMLLPRVEHSATLLRDGRVLIAGGVTCCNQTGEFFTEAAEIYDPATDAFVATGSLGTARGLHAAALLPDGRVLIAGGFGNAAAPGPLSTEIFDPATGRFTPGGDLAAARFSFSAVPLTDGRVLVMGGQDPSTGLAVSQTEIFDPVASRWTAGPILNDARSQATVTLLTTGKVLVFGGEAVNGFPVPQVTLFE
jgi:hypothetical protein